MPATVLHIQAETSSSLGWSNSEESTCTPGLGKATARGLLVTFKDVGFSIPAGRQAVASGAQKTVLIEGITGFFEPGTMTAVMGPSGSGKTTFLDCLAGRKTSGTITGAIQYGGLPASRRLLRQATGYVEQTDTLVDSLTCHEMLLYTAQLKRPRQESLASKQAAVDALVTKLSLGSCSGTQIGSMLKRGISGGQAKRLNIGLSLITEPRVLYLDEPTSGLDSYLGNEVMAVLSSLTARDGITVSATIHSPSSYCFGLFDRLLVLTGGQLVYSGAAGDAAIAYFTSSCTVAARQPKLGDNLADWILEAVSEADRQGSSLAELFRNSPQAQENEASLVALTEQQVRRRARSFTLQELQRLAAEDTEAAAATAGAGGCCGRAPAADGDDAGGGGSSGCFGCFSGGSGSSSDADGSVDARPSSCGGLLTRSSYVTPMWWSLLVLLQYRTFRNYCKIWYVAPRALEKLLFAALVVSLFYGKGTDFSTLNVPVLASLLFLMVLSPICGAVMYLPAMMMERALFIRERNDGLYRPLIYLIFRLLDELLLMVPVTAATTAAVFYGCSLQGSFLLFWAVNFSTLANGTALAYFLASVSPGLAVAMPMLCFVMIVSLILCGFMIRVAAMPKFWSWAVKANVAHYSWGALMLNQYQGRPNARLGGLGVLSYFGFAGEDAWAHLAIIGGFFVGWTTLAWLALAYARTHKR